MRFTRILRFWLKLGLSINRYWIPLYKLKRLKYYSKWIYLKSKYQVTLIFSNWGRIHDATVWPLVYFIAPFFMRVIYKFDNLHISAFAPLNKPAPIVSATSWTRNVKRFHNGNKRIYTNVGSSNFSIICNISCWVMVKWTSSSMIALFLDIWFFYLKDWNKDRPWFSWDLRLFYAFVTYLTTATYSVSWICSCL